MEKKDYYHLREIVLGLRDGYLRQAKQLASLKEMLCYDTEIIRDLSLYLHNNIPYNKEDPFCFKNTQLICYFDLNRNRLEKIMDFVILCFSGSDRTLYGRTAFLPLDKGFPANIIQAPDSRCCAKIADSQYFYDELINLSQDEFYTHTKRSMTSISEKSRISLLLGVNDISIYTEQMTAHYFPTSDMFFISPEERRVNEREVLQMLDGVFPAQSLSEYHREVISSNLNAQKEIVIPESFNAKKVKLELQTESDRVVFQKRR